MALKPLPPVNAMPIVAQGGMPSQPWAEYFSSLDANVKALNAAIGSLGPLGPLGTAAFLNAGVAADDVVQLDGAAKLPAVDASQLINLPNQSGRLIAGAATALDPFLQNSNVSVAHGLGVQPQFIAAWLECKTAEGGWSIGDRIAWPSDASTNAITTTIGADAAKVVITTGGSTPTLGNKAGGVFAITPANWKIVAVPYKLS